MFIPNQRRTRFETNDYVPGVSYIHVFSAIYIQIPKIPTGLCHVTGISLRSDCLVSLTYQNKLKMLPTWCQQSLLTQYIDRNWVLISEMCLQHRIFSFGITCTTSNLHLHWLTHYGLVMPYGESSRATLARVMACCLTAPNRYLNQCWLYRRGPLTITWEQSHNWYLSLKITSLKFHSNLTGANEPMHL